MMQIHLSKINQAALPISEEETKKEIGISNLLFL